MAKKVPSRARTPRVGADVIARAMRRRIEQRMAGTGTLKIPAVPALLEEYASICSQMFAASGRSFVSEELEEARRLLSERLREAYAGSPRSKIVVDFSAEAGEPLGYAVHAEISTLADAYERWIGTSEAPLFGAFPDARVLSLADGLKPPQSFRVLDFGAGTGRNALALGRRGFSVDALEITPKFADILRIEAEKEGLPVRVIAHDIFESKAELAQSYRLFIASEVVPDFRSVGELRKLFELAFEVLEEGGLLVVNLHLAARGYTPEKSAREFAQQCYSALFTASEVESAVAGLNFELVSDDSVHDYERAHLPDAAWPPTPWYINWVSGLDVYDLDRETCPVELRWLVYEKVGHSRSAALPGQSLGHSPRRTRIEPPLLRQALVRRLMRRAIASGTFSLPALPSLLDTYVERCFSAFRALGRGFSAEQLAEGRVLFEEVLRAAFAASPRSNIVVAYEAPMGPDLRYTVTANPVPLTTAYEEWLEMLPEPLFGAHPGARLLSLIGEIPEPNSSRVLDIGAGLGRNALALARRGFAVDAVEITPKFAELLRRTVTREKLGVRVIARDIFDAVADLHRDYRLVLVSGVAGDFREFAELRRLFEIAADVLATGALLVLSVHVAVEGYVPNSAAREWGQQCCAMFFTNEEVGRSSAGLGLELVANDSAHDFEQAHLPESTWPPTDVYSEWALGQHMYALDRQDCPIELRWLVFRRSSGSGAPSGNESARIPRT